MADLVTGCEKSRVVADAFERRGHICYSIDIEPSYQPSPHHLQMDLFAGLRFLEDQQVRAQMGIFFPECRCLCSSGQHRTGKPGQRTHQDVDNAITFFMQNVEEAEKLPRAVIENSIGIMSRLYREPDQIIQPWWFGEDASKSTCLWFFGDVPKLEMTKFVAPRMVCQQCKRTEIWPAGFMSHASKFRCKCAWCDHWMLPRWANQTDSGQNRLGPSPDRSARRADFYPGVAEAFADQWGRLLTS